VKGNFGWGKYERAPWTNKDCDRASQKSAGSSHTSASTARSRARAHVKAEAARVRASFAEKEAKLKIEQGKTKQKHSSRRPDSQLN